MTEYLKSENSTVPDDPYLYVLDQVPLHISLIDLDLNVVWANKKALESEHLLLENKCFLGFNSDMEQCTFCPVVRAISSLNTEVSMVEISDEKDESDKVYEITAIPYLNSSGLLKGVYEIRKDVSLQLNKQHKSIETKSNNRKNKEEGFSTEHLFDIISNELREHTESAIKTHNRLNTRKLTNDQKLGLVGIKTSLIKIENVLNNITIMRNLNKGILKQQKKKMDLKDLVAEKFSQYHNKTDYSGNAFDYKYDSEIPSKLIIDKTKMELILSNLIDYAMTHTSNRYIHLTTTKVNENDESVSIGFRIKNIGSIAIHDMVEKDHESYIKNNLALAVMEHLLVEQGGRLNMIPVNGYGIDIEMFIDFKKPFAATKLPFFNKIAEDIRINKAKPLLETTQKKKILIAEDEPIGRITIEQMLKKDYDIVMAKNGKVAVEKYFEENPDLVIMDIMMPVMNGFDAFDQIERNCIKRVPIIACTAKVINSEKEYLKSYGFDDYIAKPVSIKALREVIKRNIV